MLTILTGWFYRLLNYHPPNYSESDADLSDLLVLEFVRVSVKLLQITDVNRLVFMQEGITDTRLWVQSQVRSTLHPD